jgi:exopolysaccharide production protein ExoQ
VISPTSGFGSHRRPALPERAFVVLVLLLSLGAFTNLTVTGPIQSQNMGMLGMQFLWSFLYVIMLLYYSQNCRRPFRTLMAAWPILASVAFAFISVFWSLDPALTMRRSIALALTVAFGTYLASCFTLREQFRLLAWTFAIGAAFSFAFELLGLNPDEGIPGWYGIFFHKTELGRNFVLGALVFLFWRKLEPENRRLALLGFVVCVILVILSRDVTSLVTLVLMVICIPYLQRVARWSAGWAAAGVAFLLITGIGSAFYVLQHLESVTLFLGKDPMLTGRVPLWVFSIVVALQRPWLGSGFSASWLPNDFYTQRVWHILGWMPPHAHNGILELWLEVGLVGTIMFSLTFTYYCVKAMQLLHRTREPASAWPIVFLIFFFITNLTESFFITTNSIYFFLYVTAVLMCKGGKKEASLGEKSPDQVRSSVAERSQRYV